MTKISVIIPVYNSDKYIEHCLSSIVGQTFKEIEVVIIDDASTDNSIELIHKFLSKHPSLSAKVIRNEKNNGVSTTRNIGLEVSTGEYIYFCDNDDWLDSNMLERMYHCATEKGSDIVICDVTAVYASHAEIIKIEYPNKDKQTSLKKYISSTWNFIHNILAKKSLYIDNNIRFPDGLNMCEDYLVSTQLLYKSTNPYHLHVPLYFYNRSNQSSFLHNLDDSRRQMKIQVNLLAISFFQKEGEYDTYKKELCWRLLNSKQELCFQPETFKQFLEIHPESHKYILSCPYLSLKVKITMWCLTHKLKPISIIATSLRKLKYHN